MSEEELRPIDIEYQLQEMVVMVFSGLHKEEGEIMAGRGTSKFPINKIFKTIHSLSREFPDLFPSYYVTNCFDCPHNYMLESVLSGMGNFGVIDICGPRMDYHRITAETKRAMAKILLKDYGNGKIERFLTVVKRFNELMAAD